MNVEIEFLEWVHPRAGVTKVEVEGGKPLVLKAKIKQEQGEPVGWLDSNDIHAEFMHKDLKAEHDKRGSFTPRMFQIPVYTTLQQRTWIGLLDDEKEHIEIAGGKADLTLAEKIEAILKERNT